MSDASEKPDFFMRPVLTVSNVQTSIDYYCSKLGFTLKWIHGVNGQLSVAEVARPGLELILQSGTRLPTSTMTVLSAELHAHIKLDVLHQEFQRVGASIRRAPFQVPWQPHVHQMEIEDPDGNVILFWGDLP